MRLLDTRSFELAEFVDNIPKYAILSHTWGAEEVLFDDLQGGGRPSTGAGWAKVKGACDLARSRGFAWIWIDTCCINKSSSAELSEAINSMFKWYQLAEVCFVHLADVGWHAHSASCSEKDDERIRGSRWFTRGWTLQELLAPRRVEFYSGGRWRLIATRAELGAVITSATTIESDYLNNRPLYTASVAQRMSWASRRQTTRIEDTAYSLLGIFGVNMPLIYGEGDRAFQRLQEAVIRQIDDPSIFVWGSISDLEDPLRKSISSRSLREPLLAPGPDSFEKSGDVIPFWMPGVESRLHLDHNGITITTPLLKQRPSNGWTRAGTEFFLAPLQCRRKSEPLDCIALYLWGETSGTLEMNYSRASKLLVTVPKTVWLDGALSSAFIRFMAGQHRYRLGSGFERGCIVRSVPKGYRVVEVYPNIDDFKIRSSIVPFEERIKESYGLSYPAILLLEGTSADPKLALVLQFQYLSRQDGSATEPSFVGSPEWMINRVVIMPKDKSIKEVAGIVRLDAKRWTADEVRKMTNSTMRPGKDSLSSHPPSELKLCSKFDVTVSQHQAYGPKLFLVDVKDPSAENDSVEARIEGEFQLSRRSEQK
ncbi:Vegetative incompatibility protein HET-E-1 [Colletotrichum siamense]|nr:Vegetative incompatibility protein HET-E-1 [Colletotrichum siamense]